MPPIKRERDYERRRYSEWQQRQAAAAARARRRRWVLSVVGVAVVVAVIAGALYIGFGTRATDVAAGSDPAATAVPTGGAAASPSLSPLPADACPSPTALATATPSPVASAPPASLAQGRTWTGTISTSCGAIGVSLDGAAAPQAVASFVALARSGFFDGTTCHRLVTAGIQVLQCGDPTGTGSGGPGYSFGPVENAPADGTYPAGTIAMARQGGNGSSMGSQFFLVYGDSQIPADSAGGYTVFGRVTSGLDVVTRVASAGTADGASDGTPRTPLSIDQVVLQ